MDIKDALELHQKWLKLEKGGKRACFSREDLRKVDFSDYDIIGISFTSSNLERQMFENKTINNCCFTNANLRHTQFVNCEITCTQFNNAYAFDTSFKCVVFKRMTFYTDLSHAFFENCIFINCMFDNQNISSTPFLCCTFDKCDFVSANMQNIWLTKCKLIDCDLQGANLIGAKIEKCQFKDIIVDAYTQGYCLVCPEEGSFIGYKKCGSLIVKLLITEDALRSSATTRKCRCSKARVLSITHFDGSDAGIIEVPSDYDPDFVYRVGKRVEVPTFDKNRWEECSEGIHFFITREEAVNYNR